MKKDRVYSLCEAIADISYIATKENYPAANSREMIGQFIQWAMEFDYSINTFNGESILRYTIFSQLIILPCLK